MALSSLKFKMIALLILILSGTYLTEIQGQVYQNADSAFKQASIENLPVLLFFSGSDWCPHCIRFEKEVLNSNTFKNYSKGKLLTLEADFPQRKKIPSQQLSQNEELAEEYNPKGVFPTLVLLYPGRSPLSYLSYTNQSPEEFIELLDNTIKSIPADE